VVTRRTKVGFDNPAVYFASHIQPTYRIVTGSDDGMVKVVDPETGKVLCGPVFHDDWVRTVLYTTDFFISGSDDRQVALAMFFSC
jgi:hypothetical protein